jgi:glutamate-1-semialdehyde 2,1-aminomutase
MARHAWRGGGSRQQWEPGEVKQSASAALRRFHEGLEREYERRFPRSRDHFARRGRHLLDGTSHAIRWNRPFMPVVIRAEGAAVGDLDDHRILDYWQGHFANILGHNPPLIRDALAKALDRGRGLQSGMLHEVEAELSELICAATDSETVRLTTSGSLGTFYAALLARGFTGRERILKVAGGWHGSQPFGLKGVAARGRSFDHLESEGLSSSTGSEILLTRFNDVDDLRRIFGESGDQIACFLLEPMLGAGGGIPATVEYLREARRLTDKHGALLLCDEIITGFRFWPGDLSRLYGVRPDLLILGKVIGGGMPVAAVAGRRDILALCTRAVGRVKFEGGTYSAHELSLVAAATLLRHLRDHRQEVYPRLERLGESLRVGLGRLREESGIEFRVMEAPAVAPHGSSLLYVHALADGADVPTCPEELNERAHPRIDDQLIKATMLLEQASVHYGVGALSTAHTEDDLERTLEGFRSAFARFRDAGLV